MLPLDEIEILCICLCITMNLIVVYYVFLIWLNNLKFILLRANQHGISFLSLQFILLLLIEGSIKASLY